MTHRVDVHLDLTFSAVYSTLFVPA